MLNKNFCHDIAAKLLKSGPSVALDAVFGGPSRLRRGETNAGTRLDAECGFD
jgi:predicted kinase